MHAGLVSKSGRLYLPTSEYAAVQAQLTTRQHLQLWREGKEPLLAVVYSWMLSQVAEKCEITPGEEFRAAVEEATKVTLLSRAFQDLFYNSGALSKHSHVLTPGPCKVLLCYSNLLVCPVYNRYTLGMPACIVPKCKGVKLFHNPANLPSVN